jgi:hypothetical protein
MGKLALAAALACVMSVAVMAHHSAAPVFDLASQKTVTGVVREIEWTNPHIWVWIDVQGASGQVENYGFEGMSPNYLARRGWTRTSLQPGDKITVTFRPLKDGRPGGMFMSGKLESGKVLTSAGSQ